MDFSFVTPRLATGAAINDPHDVDTLVDAGITHVIDCRNEFDDTPLLASHPDLQYLWNGTADDGAQKSSQWFQVSAEFGLTALTREWAKVYCHCAAGINRGPSTAYLILRCFGLEPGPVEAMIRTARPQVGLAYARQADEFVKAFYR